MKNIKKITRIAESLDWSVSIDGNEIELEKYSPAGQDFFITITAEDLEEVIEKLLERYNDYDPSEKAYLWLDDTGHGKNGAPYDMKDVYEDMVACQDMILELHDSLNAASKWNS